MMILQQLAALQQGHPGQQTDSRSRLLQALARRAPSGPRAHARDARYASLGALAPYGETKSAETFGGQGPGPIGAFQDDAFQNDAFQVT